MITSLNQFIKYFESFVEAHDQLNDFGYGSTSEIGRSKDMQFPYLWVTHSGASSIQLQNKTQLPNMSMTFIIVDQINDQENYKEVNGADSNNCQEVLSDTFQIQQDLLSYISNYLNKEGVRVLDQGASIEPLMDETTDKVCGWVLNLDMQISHLNCAIPGDFTNVNPPPPQDCPSASVQNSDTSYSVSVSSGGTLVLPDIDITLNSGSFLTLASVKNQDIELVNQNDDPITPDSVVGNKITVTVGGGAVTDRIYQRSFLSGSQTSFYDYDEPWQLANGTYDYTPPSNGELVQLDDFYNLKSTLVLPNTFGNYKRFTGETGGYYSELNSDYRDVNGIVTTKADAFPNDYMIDHLTGLAYILVNQFTNSYQNLLNSINGLTFNGYSDYRMVNMYEFIMVNDTTKSQNASQMPPFVTHAGGYTCTYDINNNPLAQFTNGTFSLSGINPTTSRKAMICRTHYT